MTETEKDYSDFLKHLSTAASYSALLSGFILTVFTLLLTILPSAFLASLGGQVALIFVAILFYLFLFYGLLLPVWSFRFVKRLPPRSWMTLFVNGVYKTGILLFGFLIPLLFLVWGFFPLTLITGVFWSVLFILYWILQRAILRSSSS